MLTNTFPNLSKLIVVTSQVETFFFYGKAERHFSVQLCFPTLKKKKLFIGLYFSLRDHVITCNSRIYVKNRRQKGKMSYTSQNFKQKLHLLGVVIITVSLQ